MKENVHYSSIGELAPLIQTSQLSPIDIVDACLARIELLNRRLNAFVTILAEQARAEAASADAEIKAGRWRGPLHGIPIGIKDFYDTANIRTTAAFEHFKDRVPAQDAVAVANLKAAGAIIVGKTNMHQLGMGTTGLDSFFGPARNPWNEEYIPGGSSSGSAAAVAAGMCYATLDTDAIGSCRLPAACCGVVGFKGTYGLISGKGILEGEKADETILWLSHAGITGRSVDEASRVLDVVAEPHHRARLSDVQSEDSEGRRLRIGVADNFTAAEEVVRAFKTAVEEIRKFGHDVGPAAAPFDMPRFGDLRTIDSDRKTISARTFKDIDVLVLPTTGSTVPTVADARTNPQALSAANTMFANYFGLPAVSVPCGFDRHGLPLAFQVVGKPWGDRTVLRLASEYQARTGSGSRRPIQ
jgi:aspartyl-tRNA(Asn)/glutamyl-tRNA(Gln) amidotransferase subunit A